jgi:uncharacterized protein (TIGR03000 family)
MFRKVISFGSLLLLAGAVVLATPGLGQAQHGGGHGGGGHGGGGHFGGGHFGGARFGGGHFGGARFGGFRGGGFPRFFGSGFYPSYYYPYYGYPDYSDSSSYDSSPSYGLGSGSAPDLRYFDSYGGVAPPPAVSPDTAPALADTTARVTVNVPADAEIWFEGTKTTSTGSVREYRSPPLEPGSTYTYEIRARWNENGHEVDQTQKVGVTAGSQAIVSFWAPSETAGQVPSTKQP